jgi:SNF2 family DNA or RNA helicase
MVALTALLRLRQACCDLRLLDLPDIDPEEASVKLEELRSLLLEAAEGGHRVLVFSQFVQMLQILVPVLGEHGFDYCYLDGRTRRRGEVVARFQENPEIPVFLISLKAGGVGLNLTGADTVIHVDPWWNPAVEAQATDRAHRIGQPKVVTSYKLISRGTVEEKILALQERKKAAIAATLDADTGAPGLDEGDLFALFE